MRKAILFCSNPVDGGTAQVFADVVRCLQKNMPEWEIIPCIDANNPVEVYANLPGLCRLNVVSEAEALGELKPVSFLLRLFRRVYRTVRYSKTKTENIRRMIAFLREQECDTVMIHNGGYIGDDLTNQFLIAAEKAGIKNRIMVFHNDMKKSRFRKLICYKYDRMINRCATQTVTVSQFTKNRILQNSYLRKDMQVIYNGVSFYDTESLETKKRKIQYKEDAIHIGMVGNFLDNKGQLHFLKALHLLMQDTNQRIQAFIIGNVYDQEYYDTCSRYIKQNGLEDMVSICHGIRNAKEYYSLFDLTVFPSLYDESFGLISVESMHAGVPVVAYGCGGIPEIVCDNVTGYIVPTGDIQCLASKIHYLIDNPDVRMKLGENGKAEYKKRFLLERMGEEYKQILE